jgi:predicted lipase
VTGHSLGGAMASIAAGTIVSTGLFSSLKTKLITFGQPRTGNHEYSAAIDRLLGVNVYRITHADDIVPHIPPKDLDGFYHHSYEVV